MEKYIDNDCRYYRGEENNPYKNEEAWLWECEYDFCQYCTLEDSSSVLDRCMDAYERDGFGDFEEAKEFSFSFKAFLYARYKRRTDCIRPNDFKDWFSRFYLK